MVPVVAQLRDVLATPTVVIYVLSSHPLLSLLISLVLGVAFYYKSTGFKLRRFLDEIVIATIPSAAASPLIPLADDFDEWIWRVIKLTDTISQLVVYFNDGRLTYIEHQVEHVSALEEKVACVPALEQANATLETDNFALKEDNAALERTNAGLKQENGTLTQRNVALTNDNAALKQENISLKAAVTGRAGLTQENTTLKQDNAEYAQEIATLKQDNADLVQKNTTLKEAAARHARENATLREAAGRQAQEIVALKDAPAANPALEQEIIALNDTIAAERFQHSTEKTAFNDKVNALETARDELLARQEQLAAKLEAAETTLTAATASDEARSATEDKLRADVAALKKKVDHLRKQREVHLADDSARTLQYRADLVKVSSDRDAAIVDKNTAQHTLAAVTSEKDAAITAKDAAIAERNAAIAAKDAAVAEWEAEVAQHQATRRTLVDITSAKDAAVTEKDILATRQTSTARALATMTSAWKVAKKEKEQAVAQRDEAQRAVSDVVAEKGAAVAQKDEAVAEKEKAHAERDAAIAAQVASESALVAMASERDAAVAEKEAAESTKKAEDPAASQQLEAAHKVAQKKIKELTKTNDKLTNDNELLKGEVLKVQTSCNNFKNLNTQNMNRMKIIRRDRDEWKEAHDRQVGQVSAKAATLSKAENDLRESVQKIEEQEKLVTQLAARITELELGCSDSSDDVAVTVPAAQQQTPPASPDREPDTPEETAIKKVGKTLGGRFLLPSILVRRSASELGEKAKTATPVKKSASAHARGGSDSSTSTVQRDSIASIIAEKQRSTPTHSRGGSRSSTATLQRDSVLAQQNLLNTLTALGLPRDTRTT